MGFVLLQTFYLKNVTVWETENCSTTDNFQMDYKDTKRIVATAR